MYKNALTGLRGLYESIHSGEAQKSTKRKMKALGERERARRDEGMQEVETPASVAASYYMKIREQNEELKKKKAEALGPTKEGIDTRALSVVEEGSDRPRPRPEFRERLAYSESGNRYDIENDEGYVGMFQFGDARLADYKKVSGETFTKEDFKKDEKLQERVADWHFADIEETIASMDTEGFDEQGLIAVAHLGGKEGMKKFVRSGGKYNPEDSNETSLWDYYNRFKRTS